MKNIMAISQWNNKMLSCPVQNFSISHVLGILIRKRCIDNQLDREWTDNSIHQASILLDAGNMSPARILGQLYQEIEIEGKRQQYGRLLDTFTGIEAA